MLIIDQYFNSHSRCFFKISNTLTVNIFAKGLLSIGVTKGSKVGVWAKNVPDWMTFMFATAKIGAVLVTVNTNYKAAELEYIMKNADIHTMCLVNGYRDSLGATWTTEINTQYLALWQTTLDTLDEMAG